jgi:nucleoside phosphorylase
MAASAVLATKMILTFRPQCIIMVGIAAGTRTHSDSRNYGDVLVANESFDSGSGKLSARDGKSVLEPDHHPIAISKVLLTRLKDLGRKRTYLDEIRARWPARTPETALNLHVGPIGSGAAVINSRQAVREIMQHCRKMIGLEMEIYGVYVAATETQPLPKFLSFKSVCDFAQTKKDTWREYAAYTAAQYCCQFIVNEMDRFLDATAGSRKDSDEI